MNLQCDSALRPQFFLLDKGWTRISKTLATLTVYRWGCRKKTHQLTSLRMHQLQRAAELKSFSLIRVIPLVFTTCTPPFPLSQESLKLAQVIHYSSQLSPHEIFFNLKSTLV